MGDSDNYEPYDHREVSHPISAKAALIHFLKGAIGTGILAMPNVFTKAGMMIGILGMLFFGWFVAYTLHILFQCQYKLCKIKKVPWLGYGETFKYALEEGPKPIKKFSKYGPNAVLVMFIIYQLGIMTTYVQFVAENCKALLNEYELNISLEIYMLILLVPFLAINMIRHLKYLTPFSTLANVVTIGTFGIVLYYVCTDLPAFTDRPLVQNLMQFPLFFGTAVFALHSLGVVISLEQTMKNPRMFIKWNGVLNQAMLIVTVFYLIFSVLGYWKYGDESASSITLNFPHDQIAAKLADGLYAIAIYISYGLQGFVPVDLIWTNWMYSDLKDTDVVVHWEYFLRICIVMTTYIFAVYIPCLGACISFTGAFCLSILGILFPAIMDFSLHYKDFGPYKIYLVREILLFIIGILGLFLGCLCAILDMVQCVQARS